MTEIRYAAAEDRGFWFSLDGHLPEKEFLNKVRDRQGYVLLEDGEPTGLLRYNLFWDQIPFCTLLFIDPARQRQGLGRLLMARWEADMRAQGCELLMTSTQADEEAQHFYRKIGFQDCGGFTLPVPGYAQPTELIMVKDIRR